MFLTSKKSGLLAAAFLTSFAALSQEVQNLPVPLEIQKAYENGTRSTDGKPGAKYWQNHSDYKIQVDLNPATRRLSGTEQVVYTNNSTTRLQNLVVRLYPDIFKKDANRDEREIDPSDINESGVDVESISINGTEAKIQRNGTNMFVSVRGGLAPGEKLTLDVKWNYLIPAKTHIREGIYFNTSYMVAYWYPQIAVYDDIDGWDRQDYTGQKEFYNDFNTYDVNITVPASHLVWATGEWQNPDKILATEYLNRYKNSRTSSEVVKIVSSTDREKGGITLAKTGTHTYHFKAEHVPDFVFAASDTYLWDAASAVADPKTGRRTGVAAVYHPSSKDFYDVCRYAKQCVEYFSTYLPGVPFPYPNETVFNGSGGMEFPMFVNDGSYPPAFAAEVTAHEIAHTYFPFYMGINERKYAWMDEGWAQTLPNWLEFDIAGMPKKFMPQQTNAAYFDQFAGKEQEQPMMVPTNLLNGSAYTFATYMRPSQAYTFLRDMLGHDKFKATLQEYMARWNGKHPMPYDFFFSFNDYLKEDLSWYWKPWFFEKGYPDLALTDVSDKKGKTKIVVTRKGSLPVPIRMIVLFNDDSTEEINETARYWKDGAKTFEVDKKFGKPIKKITLSGLMIPDVNRKDNVWEPAAKQ
ncbi:peptidase [Siphonobacter sp. BAB-5405]|uniref:M1 family metallopeptidase n=1 Tax=Siphonobacter sp. BAB-5405 TaxID=1864825 RepID=UPI000C803C20|nr:M1 family metallopeptidase [Siphonobacter sp. BAB-5405]PMD95023.1 peptidase [Siphonobacter sp. BAB-5405]